MAGPHPEVGPVSAYDQAPIGARSVPASAVLPFHPRVYGEGVGWSDCPGVRFCRFTPAFAGKMPTNT